MHDILHILENTLMITGFVFVMMLVIEYVNVLTRGTWQANLRAHRWGQYAFCVFLGVVPGCLGSFAVVSLYAHRMVTFGALVSTMIATSGDEAFVMLALFPTKALMLFAALAALALVTGRLTDLVLHDRLSSQPASLLPGFVVHEEDQSVRLDWRHMASNWQSCSPHRGVLVVFVGLFIFGVLANEIGHFEQQWMRVTVLLTAATALFIVATVPDHFLEDHLWQHVARKHVARIFLWTLGALIVVHLISTRLPNLAANNNGGGALLMMGIACLVGLIPESGPHLVFVALFAQGAIPFSVLLASSVVQDGHGMLPMLAHSRRGFVAVKLINLAVGLGAGLALYLAGL